MRTNRAKISNFTILLFATLLCVVCFAFAAVDMGDPTEGVKAKVSGVVAGLVCALVILKWWKKFTFVFRLASCIVLVISTFFMAYSVWWLCLYSKLFK